MTVEILNSCDMSKKLVTSNANLLNLIHSRGLFNYLKSDQVWFG